MSNSLWLHGLQYVRFPCPSSIPGAYLNSCPSNQWCLPTISSSVIPFSFHLQSFPASGSLPVSQLFESGGQSVEASASVLPIYSCVQCIQGLFPLGLTGLISLLSKGLSRVFSSTVIRKHQLFGTQPSVWSNSHLYIPETNKILNQSYFNKENII